MPAHGPSQAANGRRIAIPAAAEILGVSQRTVRDFIARGDLPAVRIGSKALRVWSADVEALAVPVPTTGGAVRAS